MTSMPTEQQGDGHSPRGVLPRDPLARFNVAFALMSVIPLLLCVFLLTVKFFSLDILVGVNGVWLLAAILSALLGLWAGRVAIRQIIEQLHEVNTGLTQLQDTQAEFVSHVAHEFRAPLAIVKGALDNLGEGLHGPLTSDQQEPVSIAQRQINRLSRLVRDLLDLAQIEAGKVRLMTERLILQELLRPVTESFDILVKDRGLTLMTELPTAPVPVVGDRDRLSQVFVNLLSNALKFTRQGEIRVRLATNGTSAEVEVADTGPGIPAEDLERIFEKFERSGPQTQEGSGLGLPIAREIVELHQGRLWAESAPGRGSRFIVRLPTTG
jgi:signal transduction histidine kinase